MSSMVTGSCGRLDSDFQVIRHMKGRVGGMNAFAFEKS